MRPGLVCAGTLGLAMLGGLHGCASDGGAPPFDAGPGMEGGTGGTLGGAARAGSGANAAGGTLGGESDDESGAPSAGGAPSTGGNTGAGGTGTGGRRDNRGGTGGTRTGTGGAPGAGGSGNANGGSDLASGAGGDAGSEEAGAGGVASSNGGVNAAGTSAGLGGTAGGGGTTAAGNGGTAGVGGSTAGSASAGTAGSAGQPCVDTLNLPLVTSPPATLDLTGLYTSPSAAPGDTASYVQEYTPRYPLWSDGAVKTRWIYLPACTQIDTSDMDHWVFPVGTRFWKQFVVDGTLVETRFIHRFGTGADDWLFAAYQWDLSSGSPTAGNATWVQHGQNNANGTQHDIPDPSDCLACHEHLPEHVLGFGAFELTGNPGAIDIGVLGAQNLLTVAAPDGFTPPGTSTQQAGLGYLHTNCGICHSAYFAATPTEPPQMRLLVGQTTLEATDTYTTMVNVPTQNPDFAGIPRIKPGDHANSEVYMRMSLRNYDQMPPLGTEVVDTDGVATVAAFIDSLGP